MTPYSCKTFVCAHRLELDMAFLSCIPQATMLVCAIQARVQSCRAVTSKVTSRHWHTEPEAEAMHVFCTLRSCRGTLYHALYGIADIVYVCIHVYMSYLCIYNLCEPAESAVHQTTAMSFPLLYMQFPLPWPIELCVSLTRAMWRTYQIFHWYHEALFQVSAVLLLHTCNTL